MSKRWAYSVIGLLVVAWLAFYLSSYGALLHNELLAHVVRMHGDFTGAYVTVTLPPDAIRCTYVIATGLHSVDYYLAQRQVCPRLWNFSQ
jgi:hypothetical protein